MLIDFIIGVVLSVGYERVLMDGSWNGSRTGMFSLVRFGGGKRVGIFLTLGWVIIVFYWGICAYI
jgi:hypothetical protein